MKQVSNDQPITIDWEQFFRDHPRIGKIALTFMPRASRSDEPVLSVEITILKGNGDLPRATSQVTIRPGGTSDEQSFTLASYQADILANVIDEATTLGYHLKQGFDQSQQSAKRRAKKPAAQKAEKEGS